jgi:eukaryotic-like serine/threonine-protein kinase
MDFQRAQPFEGLHPEYTTYARQRCFVGHTHEAEWRADLLSACGEVLPQFELEPWYAEDHFDPTRPLRGKVAQAIANARYGIYDLSCWQKDERSPWRLPRNVLIELGMAIALNRPALLLRHSSNEGLPLPTCLQGVELLTFSGNFTLKQELQRRLPQWLDAPPDREWRNRFCIFGNQVCTFREAHPRAARWASGGLRCHVADGLDSAHPSFQPAERIEARANFSDTLDRYSDLAFDYLDELPLTDGYQFALCSHCQAARSAPFAIYRITPQTPAEVFIAIGMSIALEAIHGYDIPKVLLVKKEEDLPSLLRGYEVVVARRGDDVKKKLKTVIPEMMLKVRETAWKPRLLPFIEIPLNKEPPAAPPSEAEPEVAVQPQRTGDDLLVPGSIVRSTHSNYRILGLIWRSGRRAVYRVERQNDNTIWVLKELRWPPDAPASEIEENRKLLFQEADFFRSLSHLEIPAIADVFESQDRPTLVMEFVPGQTLLQLLQQADAPILEQHVIRYGIQIAHVLHYLHTRTPPIIHRDIKPSNIMVTPEGTIKMIDFSIARTFKAGRRKDAIAMGTSGYAPPEQYGKGQTDARSDVYALGATLLHLLINMPPIPLQTPAPGSIRKFNPSVDMQTEQVIIKAMALDPNQRYKSAAEFEQALTRRLDDTSISPPVRLEPTKDVTQPGSQTNPTGRGSTTLGSRLCVNCGRSNKPNARFCATCGKLIVPSAAARMLISSPHGSWEQNLDQIPLRIGRRDPRQNHYPELDLVEHDDRGIVSRSHAVINRGNNNYTLTDLGSANGTLLNSTLIPPRKPQRLQSGDRIKIGEVEIEFRRD